MKRIKLLIVEPSVNRAIGRELSLQLNDKANIVDAINEADKMIRSEGSFPIPPYRSLLHMIYNPVKNKFYKQVAITAYDESGQMLNIRDNPKQELSAEITITLIPVGGCISQWKEAIGYEDF